MVLITFHSLSSIFTATVIHYTSTLYHLLCLSSFILLLSSFYCRAQTFKYCEKNEHYALKVSGVDVSPVPPVRGARLYFKIAAYAREPITSGVSLYEISYAGTPRFDSTYIHDLCKETSCPVPVGNFLVTHKTTVPPIAPSGTYNVNLTIKDQNDKLLICITFPFKIGYGSSLSAV